MFSSIRRSRPARFPDGGASRGHRAGARFGGRLWPRVLAVAGLLLVMANALPLAEVAAKEQGKIITLGESLSEPQKQELLNPVRLRRR